MKSDHRHELKTNELAEWIMNLPQWAKDNRITIIIVSVVVVMAAAMYFWNSYNKNVVTIRNQLTFTNLVNQLRYSKMQIMQAQAQGRDLSFILLQPAENLQTLANETKNNQIAAMALIKRGEALRMELHYRLGQVSKQDFIQQINQAKVSYTQALQKASGNPTLTALAKFGLGLCEEELGNFETAEQIYHDIATDPTLDSTTAQDAAKHRLETMMDYKDTVVFVPAPKPEPSAALEPQIIDLGPVDANLPADMNQLTGSAAAPNSITDVKTESESPNNISDAEINLPAK